MKPKQIIFKRGGLNWHADLSAYHGPDYSAMPTPLSAHNSPAEVRRYYEARPQFQKSYGDAVLVFVED